MKNILKNLLLVITLAMTVTSFNNAQATAIDVLDSSGLDINISMNQEQYSATDPLVLGFTATNNTDQPITILKWATPLEGDFTGNFLSIRQQGEAVQYIGKIVKRAAPGEADFITIGAGESITTSLELSEGYAIENSGQYTVEFKGHIYQVDTDSSLSSTESQFKKTTAKVNSINFELNENRLREVTLEKAANFESCNNDQRNLLNNSLAESVTISRQSKDYLNNLPANERSTDSKYRTWFGAYTNARYTTVKSHFVNIHDALANQQILFSCNCTTSNPDNTFAYVNPSQPYRITLCGAFWRADLKGSNSKSGTLVHEASHFVVVANTDDHVYGESGAKNLANTSPASAIDNADNHEYFAEGFSTSSPVEEDSYEPDNSRTAAKTITSGIAQVHRIYPVSDEDWFKFTLNAASNLTLQTSGASDADTVLYLFNANGDRVGYNDDIDVDTNAFSIITKSSLAAGTYYAKVHEYGNNNTIANYALSLTLGNGSAPGGGSSGGSSGGAFGLSFFYLFGLLGLVKFVARYKKY